MRADSGRGALERRAARRPWLQRLRGAVRALFDGAGGYTGSPEAMAPAVWGGLLPGARFDYEAAAGNVLRNSAVAICLGWIGDNFPEAELTVERRRGGLWAVEEAHPLTALLRNPNPEYDGDALWAATAMAYSAFGNAYWLKVRGDGGRGAVRELWHLPPEQVQPVWPADGSRFLTGYAYQVNGRTLILPREDVVHFRFGFDPDNPRLGWNRLRAVLREICTDNEAAGMMAALLRNMAVPGLLIAPADRDTEIRPADAEELRRQIMSEAGGENRGRPIIGSAAWKVERLGLTPEELVLDRVRQIPEARICGALRLPPMVVGLVVGNEQRTFSNYAQARRAAYEDCLAPIGRRFASALERQLLPELGDAARERVRWDYSRVIALQDDRLELFRQNQIAVAGGWMTVEEARTRVGLPRLPGSPNPPGAASPGDGESGAEEGNLTGTTP